jgi:ABC-type dipeptide/oligopeptide/nickel transport system permease component
MLRSWGRLPAPIRYLAPRIVALPCLWLAVTLGVFLVLFVFTDPTDAYVGPHATPQARETARVRLGIDDSSFQLYVDWLSDMAHGDLGKSSLNGRTVGWSSTEERLKPTAELVVLSLLFGAVMGGAIAWLARQDRFLPLSAMMDLTSAIMASVPVFVIGVLVLVLPSQYWGYAPTLGRFESFYHQPWGNLKQAMPPAACMAVPVAVFVVADLRRRGSQGHAVGDVVRAAMRALPIALSMVIVTEPIFTIPGLGHLLYMSTVSKDFLLLPFLSSFRSPSGSSFRKPSMCSRSGDRRAVGGTRLVRSSGSDWRLWLSSSLWESWVRGLRHTIRIDWLGNPTKPGRGAIRWAQIVSDGTS